MAAEAEASAADCAAAGAAWSADCAVGPAVDYLHLKQQILDLLTLVSTGEVMPFIVVIHNQRSEVEAHNLHYCVVLLV